jgi:hypothetical protein
LPGQVRSCIRGCLLADPVVLGASASRRRHSSSGTSVKSCTSNVRVDRAASSAQSRTVLARRLVSSTITSACARSSASTVARWRLRDLASAHCV